jgi:Undecaprenyl-phosphate glucose phosphotransferase
MPFRSRYSATLAWIDLSLITAAYGMGYYLRFREWQNLINPDFLAFGGLLWLIWLSCALVVGLYSVAPSSDPLRRLWLWFRCFALFAVATYAFNGLIKVYYSRILITLMLAVTANLHVLWHWLFPYILGRLRSYGHTGAKAILIGTNLPHDFAVIQRKSIVTLPEILGYFGDEQATPFARLGPVDGCLQQVPPLLRTETVSDLYCSASLFKGQDFHHLSRMAAHHLVNLHLVPDQQEIPLGRIEIDYLGHLPIWSLKPSPLETNNAQTVKRLMDIFLSLLAVVGLLTWLIPLLALWIRLDSRGAVFFVQHRSGKDNRPFRCYKFRTMHINAEADRLQASANDVRITRIGSFLRNTSLDELPQFFNVLRGEMSVVGPRPHMLSHTESYSQVIERFMARHRVKPGITGLSQALGYRGETRTKQDMKNRVRVDLLYIQNWSPLLDLKIIGMTALSLLRSFRSIPMGPIDDPNAT